MRKTNKKITEYSFKVPIFNQKIKILCGTRNALEYKFSKDDIKLDNIDIADGGCFGLNEYIYIWFEKNPTIPIIVHESGHCVYAIMKTYGLNIEDEELFCYLQEFIIYNILQCVKITSPIVMDPINQKFVQEVEHLS